MKDFTYGSVCSGIESASVAWEPLGWKPAWFSEIEPFPCKVLKYRFPDVPNLGDMTKLMDNEQFTRSTIDLLVGGTPCQSFSLAGLRKGLASSNGNLALEYCRVLIAKRPRWFVWENVPGVLSSFSDEKEDTLGETGEREIWQTSDFATLLSAFRQCGYSVAYRVLNAQYFGVPQRRRRVFVVGYLGNDWRPPFAVLFERESLQRDITPGKQKRGKEITGALTGRPYKDRGDSAAGLIAMSLDCRNSAANNQISATIQSKENSGYSLNYINPVLTGTWWDGGQTAQTLDAVLSKGQALPEKNRFPAILQPVIYSGSQIGNPTCRSNPKPRDPAPVITSNASQSFWLLENLTLRRLTPLECERLQGFPDNWTKIPGAKDSPRYRAIGNSKAVPVVRWIGQRIKFIEENIKL